MKKKILAVLIAVSMLFSMTGLTANAATKATEVMFSRTNDMTLKVGYAITRAAVTTPEGLAVTYASSDTTIATVNENGQVVGKKPGNAVITASVDGLKASYNVNVIKADNATTKAKEVFAGYTVTVNDKTTPATYSGGTDWPITTYYFFSADSKKLGSISGQAYEAIMSKYRVNGWDAPGNNGDWVKWFADMFNAYRGLGDNSRVAAETDQIEDFRYEVIRLTNLEREKAGLPAYEIYSRAMERAQTRAEELAITYSHTRPDGSSSGTENIAKGQISPEAVVQAWMNSPGHRKNILQPAPSDGYYTATHIGVGCYKDSSGTLYWTQVFSAGPEFYGGE